MNRSNVTAMTAGLQAALAELATSAPVALTLSVDDYAVLKGERVAKVNIRLNQPAPYSLYFGISTRDGPGCVAGVNYTGIIADIAFNVGDQVKTVSVPLLSDLADGASFGLWAGWLKPYATTGGVTVVKDTGVVYGDSQRSAWVPRSMKRVFYSNFIDGFAISDSGKDAAGKPCWLSRLSYGRDLLDGELGLYADPVVFPQTNPFPMVSGKRALSAQKLTAPISYGGKSWNYATGIMTTQTLASWTYGYFELRCQLPTAPSTWPAFWMGAASGKWPPELDWMEYTIGPDGAKGTVTSTQHWIDNGNQSIGTSVPNAVAPCNLNAGNWNVFGGLWTPQLVTSYFNGQVAFSQPNYVNEAMYLMIDQGIMPTAPLSTALYPSNMLLDYVAVYQ